MSPFAVPPCHPGPDPGPSPSRRRSRAGSIGSAWVPGQARDDRRTSGFTLVELMVVLAIIGLLTTFVIINVLPSQDVAMREKARADVALIGQAIEMYRVDNMTYPRTEDGLAALVSPPATLARPDRYRSGGYLQRLPADPWGTPYQYAFPGTNGRVDIFSFGADGKPGGEGDDADIGNWQQ